VSASSRTALGGHWAAARAQALPGPDRAASMSLASARRSWDHHRRPAPIWPGSPPRGTVLARFAPV